MIKLAAVQRAERRLIESIGGYRELSEFDARLNTINRVKIRAYRRKHGQAWLGNINSHPQTPPNYTKYEKGLVRNFEFVFIIPFPDQQLYNLIEVRNRATYTGTKQDAQLLDPVFDRIDQIGGIHLVWA